MKRLKIYVLLLVLILVSTLVPNHLRSFTEGFNKGMEDAEAERSLFYFNFNYNQGSSTTQEISFQGTPIPVEIKSGNISIPEELLATTKGSRGYNIYQLHQRAMQLLSIPILVGVIWILVNLIKLIRSILRTKLFEERNIKRISHIGYVLLAIEVVKVLSRTLSYYTTEKLFHIAPYQMDYWSIFDDSNFILALVILAMNELLRMAITMKKEQELTI